MSTALLIPGSPASYYLATLEPGPPKVIPAFTHVAVVGTVSYRSKEADGDIHFNLQDANGLTLVCEITPQHPLPEPSLGELVRVYGILRIDSEHGWPEIHPVDYIESAEVTPTPA